MKSEKRYEYDYILKWAKKIKAVDYLGGQCSVCGEQDMLVLEFHHKNGSKENEKDSVGLLVRSARWSRIVDELEKCQLVCSNCHTELHSSGDNVISTKRRELKIKLLEYKNTFSCNECGFAGGTDFRALDFHHINNDDKNFIISIEVNKYGKLLNHIADELDKCEVLCRNCHHKRHINYDRFNHLKSRIDDKVNNWYREFKPIDKEQVLSMYRSGMKKADISRALSCAKSSITYLIKKYG